MASLIPRERLMNCHGSGYMETIWLAKEQTFDEAERDVDPVVWIDGDYYMQYGTAPIDQTGTFKKPEDKEYDGLDEEDFQKLICGERIWDSMPTEEEMKSTPWEEEEKDA